MDREERAALLRAAAFLATTIVFAALFILIIQNLRDPFAELKTFRVCDAIIYTDNNTIPIKLYYAWYRLLMSQGYRNKDSYDFNNVGAVGMLFIVDYSSDVGITMRNVRFPLVAVLYIVNESVVERGSFPKLISIDSIYLEPNKEYAVLKPVYAFIEYDPIFYYRYLNKTHVVEIKSCV